MLILKKIFRKPFLLFILALPSAPITVFAESAPNQKVDIAKVRNYLSGQFDPSTHPAFVKVPRKYGNRDGYYLRKEAFDAFKSMHEAARKANVNLVIRSATRNFNYQKNIWNRKWKEKTKRIPDTKARVLDILKYSSMPGTSRHHWGTEVDLNSFNNEWFTHGEGLKLFNWMTENAHKYGFYRPYTVKNAERPTGYNEEKWHWSFTPLSKQMLADAEGVLKDDNIKGFSGSEHANSLSIVKNYIFGVHPSCR